MQIIKENSFYPLTLIIFRIPEEVFSPSEFPRSYAENSHRETLVLAYAENFRKQYTHLYRDRKPLLLNPLNELNVEVSTIRVTYS